MGKAEGGTKRVSTSDTDSQKSGHINSDLNSDELVDSLNSSLNHSTPAVGHRWSREKSTDEERQARGDQPGTSRDKDKTGNEQEEAARDRADEVIRDIQRNKADLAKPAGEWSRQLETLLIDMKHFHLTSHVDRKIRAQILAGDFTVDFCRLAPQSRSRCRADQRLQMSIHDRKPLFTPVDKDNVKEINSYKQWEIAFKVFMGIMIGKWPEKADELLEYSHVIQTASLSYPWESVFNYDIAMRELITDNPTWLWGSICQRTWALELGEPSMKSHVNVQAGQQVQPAKIGWKICWLFITKGGAPLGTAVSLATGVLCVVPEAMADITAIKEDETVIASEK